jgi:hypothetical protein
MCNLPPLSRGKPYLFLGRMKNPLCKSRTNITKGLETVAEEVKKIGN